MLVAFLASIASQSSHALFARTLTVALVARLARRTNHVTITFFKHLKQIINKDFLNNKKQDNWIKADRERKRDKKLGLVIKIKF